MKANEPNEDVDRSIAETERPPDVTRAELADLRNRVDRLTTRNERLREQVDRSRQSGTRRMTYGLVGLAILSVGAGFVVSSAQPVLFALAGVALVGALLTSTLSLGRFIERGDATEVYATCAANYEAIVAASGLSDERHYVPSDDDRIRLVVPRDPDAAPETVEASVDADPGGQGLVLEPIGTGFVRELEETLSEAVTPTAAATVDQLTDALEDRFEFVAAANSTVDEGRAEIAVTASAFGPVDRFDHPVASILAVGLVAHLERPVRLEVTEDAERGQWLVTYRWDVAPTND
ncbi:hypothetical protein [Haloterrigena alkaliphila]|uniref:DUF7982 domain-containing protein n=1 Tax=Haloterrigena alkaliphila TaxID=2816475 RepID=A0A8A2VGD9_9EURY|nr:hypothetical protein [Haloterrigena alkaliphila]QSW99412.1 hypothetical protein J0X25_00195 [Haloterrigena alkaliphila]